MLGADPADAARELKESLTFEIKLANASLPREERRNASKLYHPMKLKDMEGVAKLVPDWTEYVNNVLTEDVIQVRACVHTCVVVVINRVLIMQGRNITNPVLNSSGFPVCCG